MKPVIVQSACAGLELVVLDIHSVYFIYQDFLPIHTTTTALPHSCGKLAAAREGDRNGALRKASPIFEHHLCVNNAQYEMSQQK